MSTHSQMPLEDAQNLAVSHLKQGNYRVAELILKDIIKMRKNDGLSLYLMGLTQYYMGNLRDALKYLQKAVQNDDRQAEWYCNLGIVLTEAEEYERGVEAHNQAIALDADDARAYWNKAHTLWLMGRYEEAEAASRLSVEKDPQDADGWLNLGTALVKLGQKQEAIEVWERALAINPDFAFAWNNLGNVLRDMGKLKDSAEKCRKALELEPDYPEALNNLGNALTDMGELSESLDCYKKAITLKPDYVEAHNNLSINLMKLSRFEDAKTHARIALSYREDYLDALLSLSLACRALGEMNEAEKATQRALGLQPESAEARIDLADVLFMQDRYGEAEIELRRAQEYSPSTPRVYLKLADVLERGNKPEEALEAIDEAIEINAEMPEAYLRKGQIYFLTNQPERAEECFNKTLALKENAAEAHLAFVDLHLARGDKDQAIESFEQARAMTPDMPALFYMMTKLKTFSEDDEDFQNMVKMAESADTFGLEHAGTLHFALFSAYEDIGDFDKAFEHLLQANAHKRATVPYDAKQQIKNFDMIKEAYSQEFLDGFSGKGFESDLPVFILGMPRSGTTLTEQIISSHTDVYGAGELMEVGALDGHFGYLTPDNAAKQGQRYIDQVRVLDASGKAKRITDKMPGNFAHLGKIVSILPQAKIIHTQRHPLDTCLSCFKQSFARGQYWSYELEELGQYYNQYFELMRHWRDVCPDAFIEIEYEKTVGEFETQSRALIDYVDLPWDEACLKPHKQKRTVLTASKTQVTKPIYQTSVKSWMRYEKQLEPLVKVLEKGAAKGLL